MTNTPPSAVDLFQVDKVLTSLRASDFDTESAVGEVIDNSLQADATEIAIALKEEHKLVGKNAQRRSHVITEIAFGDNGHGMSSELLHVCLKLGSSTRYNDRSGIGRFGVGATLAAISQCRRIEVYSRQKDSQWLGTYIDLEDIENGVMQYIPTPVAPPTEFFQEYGQLAGQDSGTVVIWKKCDVIEANADGNARTADRIKKELVQYISRTYRKFIANGVVITLGGEVIHLFDPLYIMPDASFPMDARASLDTPIVLDWGIPSNPEQTSKITIQMSLLPESLRPRRGWGGDNEATARRIPENTGISVLRAHREIAYEIFRGMQPSVKDNDLDRYWGCEISFSPDLDEIWTVKNIKRGAKPIDSLRKAIQTRITPVITTYRNEIRRYWNEVEMAEKSQNSHKDAEDIASRAGLSSFRGSAGNNRSLNEIEALLDKVASLIAPTPADIPEAKADIKEKISTQPFIIREGNGFGNEFMEIQHYGGTIVIVFNRSHPFYETFYSKITALSDDQDGLLGNAHAVRTAIDLLLVAYAKAESMYGEEAYYTELRTQWGMFLRRLVNEWAATFQRQ